MQLLFVVSESCQLLLLTIRLSLSKPLYRGERNYDSVYLGRFVVGWESNPRCGLVKRSITNFALPSWARLHIHYLPDGLETYLRTVRYPSWLFALPVHGAPIPGCRACHLILWLPHFLPPVEAARYGLMLL